MADASLKGLPEDTKSAKTTHSPRESPPYVAFERDWNSENVRVSSFGLSGLHSRKEYYDLYSRVFLFVHPLIL